MWQILLRTDVPESVYGPMLDYFAGDISSRLSTSDGGSEPLATGQDYAPEKTPTS